MQQNTPDTKQNNPINNSNEDNTDEFQEIVEQNREMDCE